MSEELRVNIYEIAFLLIKRMWLIILTAALFVAGAYAYSEASYRPYYVAGTSFIVNAKQNGSYPSNRPTANDIMLAQELVETYALVLRSNLVMDEVIDRLGLNMDARRLASMIKLSPIADTQVLYLEVSHGDRQLAIDIANTITEIAPEIMMRTVEIGSINVLDRARVTSFSRKETVPNCTVAGLLGIIVAVFLIVADKAVESRIISAQTIPLKLGRPCLFELEHLSRRKRKTSLLLTPDCSEECAEAYLSMGIFVKAALDSNRAKKLLVTSVLEGEGKTTVAVNLALSLSRLGHKVLLVDGNLKKPGIAEIFAVSRAETDCFDPDLEKAARENYLVSITASLFVFPFIKSSISRVNFKSERFIRITEVLGEYFDYIIFDSAEASSTDTLNLAAVSDGVLLVIRQNSVSTRSALKAIEGLGMVGAAVIGCVLNAARHRKLLALAGESRAEEKRRLLGGLGRLLPEPEKDAQTT